MDLKIQFYKGRFKQVADHYIKNKRTYVPPVYIASLCMLGRGEEAEQLFKVQNFNRVEQMLCHFWLSVYFTRLGQNKKARVHIGKILQFRHQRLSKEERFYQHQGLGFYRFFNGNKAKSIVWAQRAWEIGFASGKPFLQILALDLRGQALIQVGEFEQGLLLLKRALGIAERIDHQGLAMTLKFSILSLSSKFQKISIEQLEAALKNLKAEDSFSAQLLTIELVERLIISGQGSRASKYLTDIREPLFASGVERHRQMWQEKEKLLRLLRGQAQSDKDWWRLPEVYGSEIDILSKSKFQNFLVKQHLLQTENYLPFIPLLQNQVRTVIVDLVPDSLFIYDEGEILLNRAVVTAQLRSLLLLLTQGPLSREDIIAKLYGYKYEAYRHDPMIYSLIHRLRTAFSPRENWVEFKANRYQLIKNLEVNFYEQIEIDESASHFTPPVISEKKKEQALHWRQLWALQMAREKGFILPRDMSKQFEITAMTAYRDLQELVIKKLLKKKGRGRATHYVI